MKGHENGSNYHGHTNEISCKFEMFALIRIQDYLTVAFFNVLSIVCNYWRKHSRTCQRPFWMNTTDTVITMTFLCNVVEVFLLTQVCCLGVQTGIFWNFN